MKQRGMFSPKIQALNRIQMMSPLNQQSQSKDSSKQSSQEVRNMSNFMSGLVRHKFITRTDLIKRYQPPVKKSLNPQNDPFLMKKLVTLTPG